MQINEVFLCLIAIAEDVKCGHSYPRSRVDKMVLWPEVRYKWQHGFHFLVLHLFFPILQAKITVIVEAYNIDWYMPKTMYHKKTLWHTCACRNTINYFTKYTILSILIKLWRYWSWTIIRLTLSFQCFPVRIMPPQNWYIYIRISLFSILTVSLFIKCIST